MPRVLTEARVDLPFLLLHRDPTPPSRIFRNALLSLAVHVVMGAVLIALPEVERPARSTMVVADIRKAVTIVVPPLEQIRELTQKDPNRGKVSHSVDVRSAESAPIPSAPRVRAPAPRAPKLLSTPSPAPTVV